jgi:hypothetical protein
MVDAEASKGRALAPPYVAFSTTKTFFGTLKEHGLPGRIDRSVLGNFSGQVGSQLITALRFLRLVDAFGHPTPALGELVEAFGTDGWPHALRKVMARAYEPLMLMNLATATPSQFNDRFKELYPAEGDTLRKCMTFFLSAAKEADVSISPYIMRNKKPRTVLVKRKPKPKEGGSNGAGAQAAEPLDPTPPPPPPLVSSTQTPEQMLVELLSPDMDDAEKQAVFTLLLFLRTKKNQGAAP